jgi:hypothetical protein
LVPDPAPPDQPEVRMGSTRLAAEEIMVVLDALEAND